MMYQVVFLVVKGPACAGNCSHAGQTSPVRLHRTWRLQICIIEMVPLSMHGTCLECNDGTVKASRLWMTFEETPLSMLHGVNMKERH